MKNRNHQGSDFAPLDPTPMAPMFRPTSVPGVSKRELPDYVPDFIGGRKAKLARAFADTVRGEP